MQREVRLRSGKWRVRMEQDAARGEYLVFGSPERPGDAMRVQLPYSWRSLDDQAIADMARRPEIRIWHDEHGIRWRIAAVGPGTQYPYPFPGRYLIFDSQQTWAGVTPFRPPPELGELADEELRALRDRLGDLGGGRRRFRPPV